MKLQTAQLLTILSDTSFLIGSIMRKINIAREAGEF